MISSRNKNRICAVIPFYNESKHLSSVVNQVLEFVDIIILVDDGSTDSSIQIIPKNEKIILLSHDKNTGKGSALRTGLSKSIELETEVTITLDADNQHDPNYIPDFLEEIKNIDCIIGCRKRDKVSMPIQRRLSNYLTSKLLSLKTGYKILDSQSGYRGYKTIILSNILPDYKGFEAESEMIVKLCKQKYSLRFLEIPTIYGDEESQMRAIPTIVGFIKVLFS